MSDEPRRSRVSARTFLRIRFARPSGDAPDTVTNVRSVGLAIAVAAVLLAVFDSGELRMFCRDLPGNAVTDVLVAGADRWHALMLDLGPAHLRIAVRDVFDAIRSVRW